MWLWNAAFKHAPSITSVRTEGEGSALHHELSLILRIRTTQKDRAGLSHRHGRCGWYGRYSRHETRAARPPSPDSPSRSCPAPVSQPLVSRSYRRTEPDRQSWLDELNCRSHSFSDGVVGDETARVVRLLSAQSKSVPHVLWSRVKRHDYNDVCQ